MGSVEQFVSDVRAEFSFLGSLGFRETGYREEPSQSYAEVLYESAATGLKVWLDGRGEVDATLRRLAVPGRGMPIGHFDPGKDPDLGIRPPFMFGTAEGTPLRTAVALLASFVKTKALDGLGGDAAAWEGALAWTRPPAQMP